MRLSSQEEYGLRCLIRVGREGTEGSVTMPELDNSSSERSPDAKGPVSPSAPSSPRAASGVATPSAAPPDA